MKKFTAAVIQMNTGLDKRENLRQAELFVREAIKKGAKLIMLPEVMDYYGPADPKTYEEIPGGETFTLLSGLAREHHVWIHSGTIHEKRPGEDKPYNTCFLVGPDGELKTRYRKVHMADMRFPGAVLESDTTAAGREIVTYDTGEVGHLGLSICYDLRFGEMFRIQAMRGADILCLPACFYLQTGKDHWECLLRARAIENGCYVLAADQCGEMYQMTAYGHSLIIDPWGNTIARASDKPGVITAEIDMDFLERMRGKTCTLENRREDVYCLTEI